MKVAAMGSGLCTLAANPGSLRGLAFLAVMGGVAGSGAAQAGHGFSAIGFGAESVALASADVALARDSGALNTNPAGLTQIGQSALDLYLNPYDLGGLTHSDEFGNDGYQIDNAYGSIGAGSYAWRMRDRPEVVLAAGMFVQGGAGFVYDRLRTAFGTRDELSLVFGVFKFAGGLGWSVTPKLSLGANLGIAYTQGRQKFFPDTSDAQAGFFGQRFDGGEGWKPSVLLGLQYRLLSTLTLGAAYSSEVGIDLKGGRLTVNYEDLGLDRVTYRDAELTGFALPQEVSLGLAWRFRPNWLLAVETKWYNWDASVNSSTLRASDPDRENLDPDLQSVSGSSQLDWDDQYVVAVGIEWNYSERTRLRAGLERPSDPIPHENLSPLLNLVQKEQITAGFARDLGHGWLFEYAVQYQVPHEIRYTNEALPFGSDSELEYSVLGMVFSLGRRW